MLFVDIARGFFDEEKEKRDAKKAQVIARLFYGQEFQPTNIKPALLFLARLSHDFKISLESQKIISKVWPLIEKENSDLSTCAAALHGMVLCGFSAKHFPAELTQLILQTSLQKIFQRDSKFSHNSTTLLSQTITVFSALKNLGLLERCSHEIKDKIAAQLQKVAASPRLGDLRIEARSALKDFSIYCQQVLKIATPDLSAIDATLAKPKSSPSGTQYRIFEVLKKYMAHGVSPVQSEYEWHHSTKHRLPPSELEKTRFAIGNLEISFESRVVDERRYADIMLKDNSVIPPTMTIIEVDGEHHLAYIDGESVLNGASQARNILVKEQSGNDVVMIGVADFPKFDELKSGLEFCDSIAALKILRQKIAHEEVAPQMKTIILPDAQEAESDSDDNEKEEIVVEGAAAAAAIMPKKKKPVKTVQPKVKTEPKKKHDIIFEMLSEGIGIEDLEEVLARREFSFSIAQRTLDHLLETRNIKALTLLRKYTSDTKETLTKLKINTENGGLYFLAQHILIPLEVLNATRVSYEKVSDRTSKSSVAKLRAKLMQAQEKQDLELYADFESSGEKVAKYRASMLPQEVELMDFLRNFFYRDPKETVKEAFKNAELWKLRLAFLSQGFAKKCDDVLSALILQKAYIAPELTAFLFHELADAGLINDMKRCYFVICNSCFLQGDIGYLKDVYALRDQYNLEISPEEKKSHLLSIAELFDNPDLLEVVLEDMGCKIATAKDESKALCVIACAKNHPRTLEFLLDEMEAANPQAMQKITQFHNKAQNNIFALATQNPELLRIFFDHGVEMDPDNAYEVFFYAFRCSIKDRKFLDSITLIIERFPSLMTKEIRGRLISDLPKGINIEDLSEDALMLAVEDDRKKVRNDSGYHEEEGGYHEEEHAPSQAVSAVNSVVTAAPQKDRAPTSA